MYAICVDNKNLLGDREDNQTDGDRETQREAVDRLRCSSKWSPASVRQEQALKHRTS